jgi:hypothetical protein
MKCKADFYALWCDSCDCHPSQCKLDNYKMNLKKFKLTTRDKLLLVGYVFCSIILIWLAHALNTPIEHASTGNFRGKIVDIHGSIILCTNEFPAKSWLPVNGKCE